MKLTTTQKIIIAVIIAIIIIVVLYFVFRKKEVKQTLPIGTTTTTTTTVITDQQPVTVNNIEGGSIYMGITYIRVDSEEAKNKTDFPISNEQYGMEKINFLSPDSLIVARTKVEPYEYLLLNRKTGKYSVISTLTGSIKLVAKTDLSYIDFIKSNFFFYVSPSTFINGLLLT